MANNPLLYNAALAGATGANVNHRTITAQLPGDYTRERNAAIAFAEAVDASIPADPTVSDSSANLIQSICSAILNDKGFTSQMNSAGIALAVAALYNALSAGLQPTFESDPLARTLFVDPNTTIPLAEQNGSIATPFASLQDAHDASAAGDILAVCQNDVFPNLLLGKSIVIVGFSSMGLNASGGGMPAIGEITVVDNSGPSLFLNGVRVGNITRDVGVGAVDVKVKQSSVSSIDCGTAECEIENSSVGLGIRCTTLRAFKLASSDGPIIATDAAEITHSTILGDETGALTAPILTITESTVTGELAITAITSLVVERSKITASANPINAGTLSIKWSNVTADTIHATTTLEILDSKISKVGAGIITAVTASIDASSYQTMLNAALVLTFTTLNLLDVPGINVQTFSGPGAYVWTKPAFASRVSIYLFPVGGPGASGRKQTTAGVNISGGGSGANGTPKILRDMAASLFAANEAVTIGSAAIAGAAQTANDTNGNPGTPGGTTSFGAFLSATGSAGGIGGQSAVNSGAGVVAAGFDQYTLLASATGGAGNLGAGSGGGVSSTLLPAGAGGGGGVNSAGTVANIGGSTGTNATFPVALAGGTVGAGQNGSNGANGSVGGISPLPGQPGSGGAANLTGANAGKGGNGGFPSGGGGGGGAALGGGNSGPGGDSGGALVVVITQCAA